jgi:hypothetical protein
VPGATRRGPEQAPPPASLRGFKPHDLPGLPLSKEAAAAARVGGPAARKRVQRVPLLPRRRGKSIPPWVVVTGMLAFMVLMILGTKVEFVMTQGWRLTGAVLTFALAAPLIWFTARFIQNAPDNPQSLGPIGRFLFAWILGPMLIYFALWLAFAIALPDLLTRFAGQAFTETHSMEKLYKYERRACDYRVYGDMFDDTYQGYYCARTAEFSRLPDKGPMRVHGHASWFGWHFDYIEPEDALWQR